MSISVGLYGLDCGLARLGELGTAQLHTARLGALERVARPRGNHRSLFLRERGEQVQDKGINVRAKLGNDELYPLGHEPGNEMAFGDADE